ncbi:MAG: carbon-nitrogen hydrolase family protein [Gemmatimonadaceae bacterium]|nr:carbon-nitrogen hydrolase family protein [Gemmatimonadaceae bacterium]
MSTLRITLANLRHPSSPEESVELATQAIAESGRAGADIICFPECFVPGYRGLGYAPPAPDSVFLERAWGTIADAAREANVCVVLGTERVHDDRLLISTLVVNRDGTVAGSQDKVQLDPSEEGPYSPGATRRTFTCGEATFGVAICHEGWRYPETVRWAARRGAQLVFIPHFHAAEGDSFRPRSFADPANSFHEKALLCRAAENTIYIAAANYASEGAPTTSTVVRPDGTVQAWQPYGAEGLLVADLDLALATGLLARRYRPLEP